MKNEIFRMDRVTQIEKGVILLDNFNIYVFKGEIMGLLCINRHGLKDFLNLLSQNIPIHYGYVFFNEKLVNNYQYSSLKDNPVAIIEKKSHLVEDLTVVDNIFVLNKSYKEYLVQSKILQQRLRCFTEEINIDINPNQYVNQLSATEKFIVEVLKAIIYGAKLIVMREVSSFIGHTDLLKIHQIMRYYKNKGISFLYVCNHHEEAFTICDRVSLMENGRILKVIDNSYFKDENILPFSLDFSRKSTTFNKGTLSDIENNETTIELKNLETSVIKCINLKVAKGECVVILDSNNNVIENFKEIILDASRIISGDIFINGKSFKSSRNLSNNIEIIDENPAKTMLFYEMSAMDNLCFLLHKKMFLFPMVKKIEKSIAREYKDILGEIIEAKDIHDLDAKSLYSLIYYRIMIYCPEIVICINPYSGADMYLRHHITELMRRMIEKRITLIILSLNIADTFSVADRALVIEEGKIIEEYDLN